MCGVSSLFAYSNTKICFTYSCSCNGSLPFSLRLFICCCISSFLISKFNSIITLLFILQLLLNADDTSFTLDQVLYFQRQSAVRYIYIDT